MRISTLQSVYFLPLAKLLMEMPDELCFYEVRDKKNVIKPLRRFRFSRVQVSFAPMQGDSRVEIWLTLFGPQGEILDARGSYHLIVLNHQSIYINFSTHEGDIFLGIPDNSETFYSLFSIIREERRSSGGAAGLIKLLKELEEEAIGVDSQLLPLYTLRYHPVPILKLLKPEPERFMPHRIQLDFDYQSGERKFYQENPDARLIEVMGDEDFEEECRSLLQADPFLRTQELMMPPSFTFQEPDTTSWLKEKGKFYSTKGFKIYSQELKRFIDNTGTQVEMKVVSGQRWLEFHPQLKDPLTNELMNIKSIDMEEKVIYDENGKLHLIRPEDLKRLQNLEQYAEHQGRYFRVPSKNQFLICQLYDERMELIPQLKEDLALAEKFKNIKEISAEGPTPEINGDLRAYQSAGLQWLWFLHQYQLCGCLADDMGLGKTVQTLSLLMTLKSQKKLEASLLVAPVSAIPNWEMEIAKFTPDLTYQVHLGSSRHKKRDTSKDLLITSYATLRNDVDQFRNQEFDFIILDESQNIKNPDSQSTKAVKILKSHNRLALSGTPVENTSMELWSLFDFLLPGFLGTHAYFKQEWATPVEKENNQEKAETLKRMLYPFILRRKKEDVAKDLPEKAEMVEYLKMDETQAALYGQIAGMYRNKLARNIAVQGLEKSSMQILEGLLRLRQTCLFPGLVADQYEETPSVKFNHFRGMIQDIVAEDHKVLIFSQFVQVLERLKGYLQGAEIDFSYIDGSMQVNQRKKIVNNFQDDPNTKVFLLSLKAGGVALNLTAADYVILFDPWWNPAIEMQAIDRAHRIGQTRKVFIYRLVVRDTIEEKMLAFQNQKKDLVDKLITTEKSLFKNLTQEDILGLFQ